MNRSAPFCVMIFFLGAACDSQDEQLVNSSSNTYDHRTPATDASGHGADDANVKKVKSSNQVSSNSVDEEDEEDESNVIPPTVVSGAFLTCDWLQSTVEAKLGCNILDEKTKEKQAIDPKHLTFKANGLDQMNYRYTPRAEWFYELKLDSASKLLVENGFLLQVDIDGLDESAQSLQTFVASNTFLMMMLELAEHSYKWSGFYSNTIFATSSFHDTEAINKCATLQLSKVEAIRKELLNEDPAADTSRHDAFLAMKGMNDEIVSSHRLTAERITSLVSNFAEDIAKPMVKLFETSAICRKAAKTLIEFQKCEEDTGHIERYTEFMKKAATFDKQEGISEYTSLVQKTDDQLALLAGAQKQLARNYFVPVLTEYCNPLNGLSLPSDEFCKEVRTADFAAFNFDNCLATQGEGFRRRSINPALFE